ncbi:MAG: hypothetical protein LBV41_05125 [Cytophagaceae bacterium]|jgi:hypothetical protein|nr:hypothetical protein [Cytophagaceae bacterium]
MKEKFNRQYIGIVIGLILPLIAIFMFFSVQYAGKVEFWEFVRLMFGIQSLGKLLSVCVLPNLIVFLTALKLDYLWAVRGVIIVTLVYATPAVILALIK